MSDLPTLTVAPEEFAKYLLDADHVEGGSKARWFLSKEYSVEALELLAVDLARHAFDGWPGEQVAVPPHGIKHKILASTACPDGSSPHVLATWMTEPDEPAAWFVTARPHRIEGSAA